MRAVPRGELRGHDWKVSLFWSRYQSSVHADTQQNSSRDSRPLSTQCKTCPDRTFANAKGMTLCKVCQAGTTFDVALLISATANPCASCPAGKYRDNNRSETVADNKCSECGPGKSSPTVGSSTCTPCAPGKTARYVGKFLSTGETGEREWQRQKHD